MAPSDQYVCLCSKVLDQPKSEFIHGRAPQGWRSCNLTLSREVAARSRREPIIGNRDDGHPSWRIPAVGRGIVDADVTNVVADLDRSYRFRHLLDLWKVPHRRKAFEGGSERRKRPRGGRSIDKFGEPAPRVVRGCAWLAASRRLRRSGGPLPQARNWPGPAAIGHRRATRERRRKIAPTAVPLEMLVRVDGSMDNPLGARPL
jgi:hypothetical protein